MTALLNLHLTGLAKKVLLANNVAKIAALVYTSGVQGLGTSTYWLAAVAYTLQIYYDFSRCSDMAIGFGRIFGPKGRLISRVF